MNVEPDVHICAFLCSLEVGHAAFFGFETLFAMMHHACWESDIYIDPADRLVELPLGQVGTKVSYLGIRFASFI